MSIYTEIGEALAGPKLTPIERVIFLLECIVTTERPNAADEITKRQVQMVLDILHGQKTHFGPDVGEDGEIWQET